MQLIHVAIHSTNVYQTYCVSCLLLEPCNGIQPLLSKLTGYRADKHANNPDGIGTVFLQKHAEGTIQAWQKGNYLRTAA